METVKFADRIGILGGTFDPVHTAHLELAETALKQFGLDTVLFIPAGMPVRKLGKTHVSARHRLNMLRAACKDRSHFKVSSLEVDRECITYTIDTLRELKELYGDRGELFMILGGDTVTDLATWKDAEEIAELATILYARRPSDADTFMLPHGFSCYEIQMPVRQVSSSYVRQLLQEGGDVSNFVPPEVLAYIKKHGLYDQSEKCL